MELTPEERAAIKRRMAEFADKMAKPGPWNNPADINEWAVLYEERDALGKQLGDPPVNPGPGERRP